MLRKRQLFTFALGLALRASACLSGSPGKQPRGDIWLRRPSRPPAMHRPARLEYLSCRSTRTRYRAVFRFRNYSNRSSHYKTAIPTRPRPATYTAGTTLLVPEQTARHPSELEDNQWRQQRRPVSPDFPLSPNISFPGTPARPKMCTYARTPLVVSTHLAARPRQVGPADRWLLVPTHPPRRGTGCAQVPSPSAMVEGGWQPGHARCTQDGSGDPRAFGMTAAVFLAQAESRIGTGTERIELEQQR